MVANKNTVNFIYKKSIIGLLDILLSTLNKDIFFILTYYEVPIVYRIILTIAVTNNQLACSICRKSFI